MKNEKNVYSLKDILVVHASSWCYLWLKYMTLKVIFNTWRMWYIYMYSLQDILVVHACSLWNTLFKSNV